ncbi:MAG: hypothetical protein ABSC37_20470 [Xanthobacteraceae bacterium]|jgi:hypothetical protein
MTGIFKMTFYISGIIARNKEEYSTKGRCAARMGAQKTSRCENVLFVARARNLANNARQDAGATPGR